MWEDLWGATARLLPMLVGPEMVGHGGARTETLVGDLHQIVSFQNRLLHGCALTRLNAVSHTVDPPTFLPNIPKCGVPCLAPKCILLFDYTDGLD